MTYQTPNLKAPFPYFGGKQTVSDQVWERFGNPSNYIEPFAGSAAILLRRPDRGKVETVNDANHYLVNFWRSVQGDPELVAKYADWPVTEADLHARHRHLMFSDEAKAAFGNIAQNPEYFNAKLAGWWVWGQCCWIGGGWCTSGGTRSDGTDSREQIPELQSRKGIQSVPEKRPATTCGNSSHLSGVHGKHQIPDLSGDGGAFGRGVHSSAGHNKLPLLNSGFDSTGTGVHAKRPRLESDRENVGCVTLGGRPQLGDVYDIGRGVNGNNRIGTCAERRQWLTNWICQLSDRLRLVRICYGHWSRVCDSRTTLTRLGDTAVFLDPPYAKNVDRLKAILSGEAVADEATATNRAAVLYSNDKDQDVDQLVAEVNQWCQKWGDDPLIKIALCGYEGEHDNLEQLGWEVVSWKAHGGYGNRNANNRNKHRERIWYSPGCNTQPMLF